MGNFTHPQNPNIQDTMARPRKPTALLELQGAFNHDPQRKRARQNEPLFTTPLPDPPETLRPYFAKAWRQIKARGYWLTSADQFLVKIAATLTALYFRQARLS